LRDITPSEPAGPDRLGGYLCPHCIRLLLPITTPMCSICGRPYATDHGLDHICGRCESTTSDYQAARAVLGYTAAIRRIIHQYKYQGCTQLAKPLGNMLWEALLMHWDPEQIDVVIPVPLHRHRLRRRGFNQSAQLLRNWPSQANALGVDADCFQILPEVLVRQKATKPQTGLDADARRVNMRNAFTLRDAPVVKLKHVLLIDDVLTTGATANACAQVLKRAGADSISVLTLARAV
jgi:ComF family protein